MTRAASSGGDARRRWPVPAAVPVAGRPGWGALLAGGALLAALVVAVFSPVVSYGFVGLDDGVYVFENLPLRDGSTGAVLRWSWTTTTGGNWHPLTWLSYLLDIRLWGWGPAGHHATNLGLHLAAALALFLLLAWATDAVGRSLFVAAVFAVHPLHVESVSWVAERKDVLCGLFWMLALASYQRYAGKPGTGRYLVLVSAFACALLAKPMAVTLPVVLLAWDLWPLRRWQAAGGFRAGLVPLVVEKLPLFALALAAGVVAVFAQRAEQALVTLAESGPIERLATAVQSIAWYVVKSVAPTGLAVFYPQPAEVAWGFVLGAALLVAGLTAIVAASRFVPVVTGWSWFVVGLLPVIGLVQVGGQARADRYTYIPLVGLAIVVGWGVPRVLECFATDSPRSTASRRSLAAAAVLAVLGLGTAAHRQVDYWRDGRTLMERAVAVDEANWLAHNALGRILSTEGRFEEAERHLRRSIELLPANPDAWFNLGVVQTESGRPGEAETSLINALRLRPRWPEAQFDLGVALQALGRWDDAALRYRQAIAERPDYVDAYNNLGAVHLAQGDLAGAEAALREAVRQAPGSPNPHLNLGLVHLYRGERDEALREIDEARRLGGVVSPAVDQLLAHPPGAAAP